MMKIYFFISMFPICWIVSTKHMPLQWHVHFCMEHVWGKLIQMSKTFINMYY